MKVFALILLLLPLFASSQDNIPGQYHNNFGSILTLRADSTFKYEWHFDTQESWTNGTWRVTNDTVHLKVVLVYDTLTKLLADGSSTSSLVLARFDKSVKKTPFEIALANEGWQNREPPPDKMLYRKSKLYEIHGGKVVKKKTKGLGTRKQYVPWYTRQ